MTNKYDAELREATWNPYSLGSLTGRIYNDSKGRFANGRTVTTSMVKSHNEDIYQTFNTKYKVTFRSTHTTDTWLKWLHDQANNSCADEKFKTEVSDFICFLNNGESITESLRTRVSGLIDYYDKMEGTPCEQIRHAQEIEDRDKEIERLKKNAIPEGYICIPKVVAARSPLETEARLNNFLTYTASPISDGITYCGNLVVYRVRLDGSVFDCSSSQGIRVWTTDPMFKPIGQSCTENTKS